MLNPNYDVKFDTLYLSIEDNSQSYSAEVVNNINVFRDMFSDAVTGFLIFGFIEKYKNNSLPALPYDVGVDLLKDVVPLLRI